MSIDWASLGLVAAVTVLGTGLVLAITSSAARMLGEARLKRTAGQVRGLRAAELAAGFFLALALGIVLFGLWLMIPYYH
ncbi:hypothetical protein OHJ16_06230 [Actinomyces israelii]|uniref:Uncharacterized protein n=1 Tax=Actinomyces israelii TaxID=1659 RepID=A0ABT4I7C5_9ACTO|nr:hypothetical protein [Actinomyces israelii]MCZ0857638.1 hypothetical protein [Actinomyces israelii]WKR21770.1 hypothetical protein AIF0345_1695 [Actinomyces israelii]